MSLFDRQKSKTKRFKEVTKGKTKEEIRVAEENLLKPEDIAPYLGDKPAFKSDLSSRTALIVFKDEVQKELIGELFNIRTSVNGETYVTDISLLEKVALAVRNGDAEVIGESIVFTNTQEAPKDPNTVYSMQEFQEKYFPKDVGKKCFECGRKIKKKKGKWATAIDKYKKQLAEDVVSAPQESTPMEYESASDAEIAEKVDKVAKPTRGRRKL